jgi:two-component system LytT family sensor kinase
MEDATSAVLTLGFTAGTVLFTALAVLAWKAGRVSGREPGVLGLAAAGLLWNGGRLVVEISQIADIPWSTALSVTFAAAFSSTALLPPLALAGLRPIAWAAAWQERASSGLRIVSWTIAGVLTVVLLAAAAIPGDGLRIEDAQPFSAYNLAFHLAVGAVVYWGATFPSPAVRAFARSLLVLGAALAVCLAIAVTDAIPDPWEDLSDIAAQLLSIPVGIAALVVVARFRFADIFIRRAASLLAALVIASAVTLLVGVPTAGASKNPDTAALVVTAAVWCALLLAFPRLERSLGRAADRWLFRRPDYVELGRTFGGEVDALESQDDVLAAGARLAREALRAERTRVVAAEEIPLAEDRQSGAFLLPPDHPAKADALVPVWSGGRVSHYIAVVSGEGGRALLSDELAFLSGLGDRAGRRVEAIRAERERREAEVREANLRVLVTEARLRALRAQLNPHFLFNTLNTILDLIESDPARAGDVTEQLADVLRYVLDHTDRELIPVEEEIEFLRSYLDIERARFGDRLRVEMEVDPAVATSPVPALILQPLVENAVRHGLGPKPEGGTLRIATIPEGSSLRLIVEDDGVGMGHGGARGSPPTTGIGIPNVEERLRTLYGDAATMTTHSEPGRGTRVEILIPRRDRENPDRRRRSAGEVAPAEAAGRLSGV